MIETGDMQFESRMVTPKQVEEDSEVEVSCARSPCWNTSDRTK